MFHAMCRILEAAEGLCLPLPPGETKLPFRSTLLTQVLPVKKCVYINVSCGVIISRLFNAVEHAGRTLPASPHLPAVCGQSPSAPH